MIKIALIGDRSDEVIAHRAIPKALQLVADKHNTEHRADWIHSTDIHLNNLSSYQGIWCVPASPYRDADKVINAIHLARESNTAFIGTCGGYQHAAIEFARNVLGYRDASSVEDNPETTMPLINAMFCEMREKPGQIRLAESSQIEAIYNQSLITEQYNCGFGINTDYLSIFENTDMKFTAWSMDSINNNKDDPRALELTGHRFYMATAFQPERSALTSEVHPLIESFFTAASQSGNNDL